MLVFANNAAVTLLGYRAFELQGRDMMWVEENILGLRKPKGHGQDASNSPQRRGGGGLGAAALSGVSVVSDWSADAKGSVHRRLRARRKDGRFADVMYSWAPVVEENPGAGDGGGVGAGGGKEGIVGGVVIMAEFSAGNRQRGLEEKLLRTASVIMNLPGQQRGSTDSSLDSVNTWSTSVTYYNDLVNTLTELQYPSEDLATELKLRPDEEAAVINRMVSELDEDDFVFTLWHQFAPLRYLSNPLANFEALLRNDDTLALVTEFMNMLGAGHWLELCLEEEQEAEGWAGARGEAVNGAEGEGEAKSAQVTKARAEARAKARSNALQLLATVYMPALLKNELWSRYMARQLATPAPTSMVSGAVRGGGLGINMTRSRHRPVPTPLPNHNSRSQS